MRKILIVAAALVIVGGLIYAYFSFPKKYSTYPGLIPPHMVESWKPGKCLGFSKKIRFPIPDGPDMICYGIVYR